MSTLAIETTRYQFRGLFVGPETRNPKKNYCTCSGRNCTRAMHATDMLADSILTENGNTLETHMAPTLLLSETAARHCHEDEQRIVASSMQVEL